MSQLPEEQPLKCPKCNVVHLVTQEDQELWDHVHGVEGIRERVHKRNEVKLRSLYPNVDAMSAEV